MAVTAAMNALQIAAAVVLVVFVAYSAWSLLWKDPDDWTYR